MEKICCRFEAGQQGDKSSRMAGAGMMTHETIRPHRIAWRHSMHLRFRVKVRPVYKEVLYPPATFSCTSSGVECEELNLTRIIILPSNYKEKKEGQRTFGCSQWNGVTDNRTSPGDEVGREHQGIRDKRKGLRSMDLRSRSD